MERDWVIELDSSSPAKFSRHVIIRIPGAAFQDALSAGGFCSMVLKQPGMVEPLLLLICLTCQTEFYAALYPI